MRSEFVDQKNTNAREGLNLPVKPIWFLLNIWLTASILTSCAETVSYVDFSEEELIRLLSADSSKTWTRTGWSVDGKSQGSDDCQLKRNLTFIYGAKPDQSLRYFLRSDSLLCGSPDSILSSGDCLLIDVKVGPESRDSIYFVSGTDTLCYSIENISSLFLQFAGIQDHTPLVQSFEWLPR